MHSRYQAALIALLLAWSVNTRAEITLCTEVIPPATITQPGIYCLLKDYVVSNTSPAISIRANNVVLDLNGHRIGSGSRYYVAGSPPTRAIRIEDVQNVTIRNGTIRGFATGISLSDLSSQKGLSSQNHLIEDLLIEGVAGFGIQAWYSYNSIFRRNRIYGFNPNPNGGDALATGGIYVFGDGNSIQDNIAQNFSGKGHIYGIFSAGRNIVENNYVSELIGPGALLPQPVYVKGIACLREAIVSGNKVMNISSGKAEDAVVGISADERAKLIGNVVSGVSGVSYVGGIQIPGTNY